MNVKNDANITHGCVKTEAFTMRYFSFGRGERPLVILPGLSVQSVMGSAQAVAKEYSVMQEEFTVYLFDRREDLPSKYSVYDMAQDTALSSIRLPAAMMYHPSGTRYSAPSLRSRMNS